MTFGFDRKEMLVLLTLFFIAGAIVWGLHAHFGFRGVTQGGYADLVRYKPDLNSATEDELSLLPGVGPRGARAIVSHRETRRFTNVDELADARFPDGKAAFDSEKIAKLKKTVTVTAENSEAMRGSTP
jgi:hypothetical protein